MVNLQPQATRAKGWNKEIKEISAGNFKGQEIDVLVY